MDLKVKGFFQKRKRHKYSLLIHFYSLFCYRKTFATPAELPTAGNGDRPVFRFVHSDWLSPLASNLIVRDSGIAVPISSRAD